MTPPVVVAHNRYPVTLVGPGPGDDTDTIYRNVRFVLTVPTSDQPARLMAWSKPGDPVVDEAVDLEESTIKHRSKTWTVSTPAGLFVVQPGRGCGCSSPLKHWQPFDPMTMGSLP